MADIVWQSILSGHVMENNLDNQYLEETLALEVQQKDKDRETIKVFL